MADHPRIFVDHPLASKTEKQVLAMAENAVDAIVEALTKTPKAAS